MKVDRLEGQTENTTSDPEDLLTSDRTPHVRTFWDDVFVLFSVTLFPFLLCSLLPSPSSC
jgi:hypothetical protein